MKLYKKASLVTFYALIIIILINIILFVYTYKRNIEAVQEKNLVNLVNIVYLLGNVSYGHYGNIKDIKQLQSIIYFICKSNHFNVYLTNKPFYQITFNQYALKLMDKKNASVQAIKFFLVDELQSLTNKNQYGISFLLGPQNKWINIQPEIILSTNTISLLSLQLIFSIILIIYALATYRLKKRWENINESLVKLGLNANELKIPLYGPFSFTSFAVLIDKILERVKQLIQERTITMAALSHDIRTPLTKLRWRIELIDDPELHQALIPKIDQIEQFLKITLTFAKESYQGEAKSSIEIISLLKVICEEYSHANVSLSFHSNINRFIINAQYENLIRAFGNLIDNGLKYGNKVEVIVKQIRKNILQIVISDQGRGIPEHLLNKVFEPFFRYITPDNKEVTGSGLGLAFVKSVIKFNNGDIFLKNKAEKGLNAIVTFTI